MGQNPGYRSRTGKVSRTTYKNQRKAASTISYKYIIAAILVLAAAAWSAVILRMPTRKATIDVNPGLAYMKSMSDKSSEAIENNIKMMKAQRDRERRIEAREKALAEGSVEVWDLFSDYVMVGDSRVVGFSAFGFLESDRVLANSGNTIMNISDYYETIEFFNPTFVFLSFGANDLGMFAEPEDYVEEYKKQINRVKQAAPNAMIIVSSVMPIYSQRLINMSGNYNRIDEFNEALQVMCQEEGLSFVDNTELANTQRNLYESDGIHFKPDFYEGWALNLINGEDAF